jgi:hypothetical protein
MATTTDSSDATALQYRFAFTPPFQWVARVFGVDPGSAGVTLEHDRFVAQFGPWRVETPLSNLAGAEVTGPYQWPKVIGPAHLSLRDRGLTFATNDRQGVCIRFREPVRGIDPLGLLRHPALTVTVADPASLAEVVAHAASLNGTAERDPDDRAAGAGRREAPTLEAVVEDVTDDLHTMSARELRQRAKELGIEGVSSMKKDELIDVLTAHGDAEGEGS